ncbi:pilin [Variovorax sp. ZT5P49]|uniref:pilin n=1 Tax=Variovorax sp. ZT5P49 TaxID=3443733 RepID=UPI003F464EE6
MNRRTLARRAQAGFTLIELMIVVAIIGILAAIAIPQYQTYVAKSQVQRVVSESGALKTAIEACLLDGKVAVGNPTTATNCDPQATGSNLQVTGGNAAPTIATTWATAGSGVPAVTLSATAASTIVASFGNSAATVLKTTPGTITWSRSLEGTWTCVAANVDAKYTTSACPLAAAAP